MQEKNKPKIPQNLEEAADVVRAIGKIYQGAEETKLKYSEEKNKLNAECENILQELQWGIDQLLEVLQEFADENRMKLTWKKKSVETETGIFGWKFDPPSVHIENEKSVTAKLLIGGFRGVVRVVRKVNKRNIMRIRNKVKHIEGIEIRGRSEYFFVKPDKIEKEIILKTRSK